jgi:hypothetical protein
VVLFYHEANVTRPNTRVKRIERGTLSKDYEYEFSAYFDNEKLKFNKNTKAVTLNAGIWHELNIDDLSDPALGNPLPYIHQFDNPTDDQLAEQAEQEAQQK